LERSELSSVPFGLAQFRNEIVAIAANYFCQKLEKQEKTAGKSAYATQEK